MLAAIRLLHKRECDYFNNLFKSEQIKKDKFAFEEIWFWGLERWGQDWVELDSMQQKEGCL